MHRLASIGLALGMLAPVAMAQAFKNLDFEAAIVNPSDPASGILSWDLAVPHWTHGGGPDSDIVYQGLHHVRLNPWYQLIDAQTQGLTARRPVKRREAL